MDGSHFADGLLGDHGIEEFEVVRVKPPLEPADQRCPYLVGLRRARCDEGENGGSGGWEAAAGGGRRRREGDDVQMRVAEVCNRLRRMQ